MSFAIKQIPRLLILKGVVQHYDWGGFEFIPRLLGLENREQRPFAELWIGDHLNGRALTQIGSELVGLDELLDAAPELILGPEFAFRYQNRLPFLFKILDANKMLSIQAHPTREQASAGFAREEAAGISLRAPQRNYKDRNPKPEIHVALSEFWMLHGFRPLAELRAMLGNVPEFAALASLLLASSLDSGRLRQSVQNRSPADCPDDEALLRRVYEHCMKMPQARVDAILNPLIARLEKIRPTDKGQPDFWAWRAARQFPRPDGGRDRGLFSIYLLNLIHLRPGQGTFQPAGVLHAYLEGATVELMANSDNVLRGGLTPKHVDADELLRILKFSSERPQVLLGDPISDSETVYRTTAEEFQMSRISVCAVRPYRGVPGHQVEVLILLDGAATVCSGNESASLQRGSIVLVPHRVEYTIEAGTPTSLFYKATAPSGFSGR